MPEIISEIGDMEYKHLNQVLHKNISDIYQRYISWYFHGKIQTGRRWFCRKEQI